MPWRVQTHEVRSVDLLVLWKGSKSPSQPPSNGSPTATGDIPKTVFMRSARPLEDASSGDPLNLLFKQ